MDTKKSRSAKSERGPWNISLPLYLAYNAIYVKPSFVSRWNIARIDVIASSRSIRLEQSPIINPDHQEKPWKNLERISLILNLD